MNTWRGWQRKVITPVLALDCAEPEGPRGRTGEKVELLKHRMRLPVEPKRGVVAENGITGEAGGRKVGVHRGTPRVRAGGHHGVEPATQLEQVAHPHVVAKESVHGLRSARAVGPQMRRQLGPREDRMSGEERQQFRGHGPYLRKFVKTRIGLAGFDGRKQISFDTSLQNTREVLGVCMLLSSRRAGTWLWAEGFPSARSKMPGSTRVREHPPRQGDRKPACPSPTRARAHLGRGASRCGSRPCTAGSETVLVRPRSSPADRRNAARCSHRPRPPPSPG